MHHSLGLYSRYRESFLRYYIFQAKWTRIPLVGKVVRRVANLYGKKASRAYLLTLDEANEIVDISEGLALGPCTCRAVFRNCDNPINAEIMVGLSRNMFIDERPHDYREITKQEAKDILRQCHQNGLIHTIVKCRQDFYAICNCCSCCCVPLRLNREHGIGNALSKNNGIIQEFEEQLRGRPRHPTPLG
ncbi:ferredoxin-like protein [Chloroflexota bacterium]